MKALVRLPLDVWAFPASSLEVAIIVPELFWGARPIWRQGIPECHGPPIRWRLDRLPAPAMSMTLGHVVVGHSAAALDVARDRER